MWSVVQVWFRCAMVEVCVSFYFLVSDFFICFFLYVVEVWARCEIVEICLGFLV
jgi:hypothetical protein